MTTPNIEELIARNDGQRRNANAKPDVFLYADNITALQSQAERIKVIERESEMRRIALHDVMLESDQLRAQLAGIAATEPVGKVEISHDINDAFMRSLPIGTKLFTHPMPVQDVTELVEALEMIVSTHQGHCEHYVGVSKHSYNLADIAEEALSKYKGAKL